MLESPTDHLRSLVLRLVTQHIRLKKSMLMTKDPSFRIRLFTIVTFFLADAMVSSYRMRVIVILNTSRAAQARQRPIL